MSRKPNYRGHISRGALDFPRTAIKAKAQRLAGLALQDGLAPALPPERSEEPRPVVGESPYKAKAQRLAGLALQDGLEPTTP